MPAAARGNRKAVSNRKLDRAGNILARRGPNHRGRFSHDDVPEIGRNALPRGVVHKHLSADFLRQFGSPAHFVSSCSGMSTYRKDSPQLTSQIITERTWATTPRCAVSSPGGC